MQADYELTLLAIIYLRMSESFVAYSRDFIGRKVKRVKF